MRTRLLLLAALLLSTTVRAADLPTVTVEHLYYLQARADRVRKFKPDEMVNYCLTEKIGGTSFDLMYSQLFSVRTEAAKLLASEDVQSTDQRLQTLNKSSEVYTRLLREEALKVQDGIVREGQIASDALTAIGRAQIGR